MTFHIPRAFRWTIFMVYWVVTTVPLVTLFVISLGDIQWFFDWGEALQDWADAPLKGKSNVK